MKSRRKYQFKQSVGWLGNPRRDTVLSGMKLDVKDLDEQVVIEWELKLLWNFTNKVKRKKCVRGKMSKDRLTVFLYGGFGGENGNASCYCKYSKTGMFQKPENWKITCGLMK